MPRRYVLDTSLLLGGRDPPRDATWTTTPEAASEVSPGGKDHRRFDLWLAAGLRIESAPPETLERVADAGLAAGNLGRLSPADLSLLALALEQQATLVTDDFTMLDVAMRLSIPTQTVNQQAPRATLDFRPRCLGCGRWFDAMPKKEECPVCGSPVKLKPATAPPKKA
ncbi:MAG: nucleotide-binding protein [Thermoplasmatota archaeon]